MNVSQSSDRVRSLSTVKESGPSVNARGMSQGGPLGPLVSDSGSGSIWPNASTIGVPQGGTLGPLMSASAWHQADKGSKFRSARLSLPEWTQTLNERDIGYLTLLKYKITGCELVDDSNEAIQALRCQVHTAELSLQEDGLDENELANRQSVKRHLDQQLVLKTHKAGFVDRHRQALDRELDRLRIAYFQDDGVTNFDSESEQSDNLCLESKYDSEVSAFPSISVKSPGVQRGGALSPSHGDVSGNTIMPSCHKKPKMKVSNFIKDSIKVIDSACQADLPNPQEESQRLRQEECIKSQHSTIQDLSGKLHQAYDTIDHLKRALEEARSKQSIKVVDMACQAELPDPYDIWQRRRIENHYQGKIQKLSEELQRAFDHINHLEQVKSPILVESASQVESPATVDTASQYDSPTLVESASQVECPFMVESSSQVECPVMVESSSQVECPFMVESSSQVKCPVMVESSSQVECPVMVESSSQVECPTLVESACQMECPTLVESACQMECPILVESACQVECPTLVESACQMEWPIMVESASQGECPAMVESASQVEWPTLVESGSQADPPDLVESGSQVDPPSLVESGSQVDIGEYGLDRSQITQVKSDVEDLDASFMSIPDGEYLDAECGLDSGYVDSDLWEALEPSQSEVTDDSMSIPDDEYLDAECGLDSGYVDSDLLVELESSDSESLDYLSSSDDECLDVTEGSVSTVSHEMSPVALPDVDTLN